MKRMADFAELTAKEIDCPCEDIHRTDRFAFLKIGPVLSISVSELIGCSLCKHNESC